MSNELSEADLLLQKTEGGLKVLQQRISSLSNVINAILPVLNEYATRLQKERNSRRQSERMVLQIDLLRKTINGLEQDFNTHFIMGKIPKGTDFGTWKKMFEDESLVVGEFRQLFTQMQFDIDCLKKPKEA